MHTLTELIVDGGKHVICKTKSFVPLFQEIYFYGLDWFVLMLSYQGNWFIQKDAPRLRIYKSRQLRKENILPVSNHFNYMNHQLSAIATVLSLLSTSGVMGQTSWANPFGTGVQVIGGRSNQNMQAARFQQPASAVYGGYQSPSTQQASKKPWYHWLTPKKSTQSAIDPAWLAPQNPAPGVNPFYRTGAYPYDQQIGRRHSFNQGNAIAGGISALDLPDMGAQDSIQQGDGYAPVSYSAFGGYERHNDDISRIAGLAGLGVRQPSYIEQQATNGAYAAYGASDPYMQMGSPNGPYNDPLDLPGI